MQNFGKNCEILEKNSKKSVIFNENFEIRERCKGVHTAQHQNTTERTLIQRSSTGHPTLREQTSQKISDQ